MDELYFVLGKRKDQFKIKKKVGSFISNTRTTGVEVDTILKRMNFHPSFTWSYDPFIIISNLRVELKKTPYNYTPVHKLSAHES